MKMIPFYHCGTLLYSSSVLVVKQGETKNTKLDEKLKRASKKKPKRG